MAYHKNTLPPPVVYAKTVMQQRVALTSGVRKTVTQQCVAFTSGIRK